MWKVFFFLYHISKYLYFQMYIKVTSYDYRSMFHIAAIFSRYTDWVRLDAHDPNGDRHSGSYRFVTHQLGTWWAKQQDMMTSSNGNTFRVTGLLCGEFTGPARIGILRSSGTGRRLGGLQWPTNFGLVAITLKMATLQLQMKFHSKAKSRTHIVP